MVYDHRLDDELESDCYECGQPIQGGKQFCSKECSDHNRNN